MFDTQTGNMIVDFEEEDIEALAYSPDMKKIVVAKWLQTHIMIFASDENAPE